MLKAKLLEHVKSLFPGGQFFRYLCVGVFNTLFGYGTYAGTLWLVNHVAPQRYLYLSVIAASVISTPVNIVVAYFGYKFFVFRTKGNYLRECIKCFGVYGVGMLLGLVALSAVTRFLQSVLHHPHAAGYIAGALVQGFTVIISFLGHRNITFRQQKASEKPVG